jgi:hypothetical protein
MKSTNKQIKLNWSKLVGFSLAKGVPSAPDAKRTKSMIGLKAQGVKATSPDA